LSSGAAPPPAELTGRAAALATAFFLLLSGVFFGANIFAGEAIGPMDLLSWSPGYSEEAEPIPIHNNEKSDILDSYLPALRYVKGELRAGRVPLWNPLPGGGELAFPNLSYGFVSPRYAMFLLFPDGLGYTLGLIVQMAIAGLGAFLLLRRGLGTMASLFGGATFMMCGFNASWTQWPQVNTSCWIPWVLWALVRLVERPGPGRVAALAAAVAAMLFGGFPAVAGYGFYLAGLLGVFLVAREALQTRSLSRAGALAGAGVAAVAIAVLLVGFQLLPFLDYFQQFDISHRRGGGMPPSYLYGLIDPWYIGRPRVEYSAYVGIATLVFACAAVFFAARRAPSSRSAPALSTWFWLAVTALTLSAVYRLPPLASLLYRLPILNFNPSQRMTSVLGLELAVLAAVGLQGLLDLARQRAARADRPARAWKHAALFAAVIFAVHCAELMRIGRVHNARVPANAFFPSRPTIEFVKERIGPAQSVLAIHDAYFIPGTLGSYGLSDWFAHTYRRAAEKAVLEQVVERPWASWTAAAFSFDRVKMDSPWLDALGIRFVMTTDARPPVVAQLANDRPSELVGQRRIAQSVKLGSPARVCSLGMLFGTYDRAHADAGVRLTVANEQGETLARSVAPAETVLNNRWAEFKLDKPISLAPGVYELHVESVQGKDAAPLSVWSFVGEDRYPDGHATVDGAPSAGDLAFKLTACDFRLPDGWRVARERNGLAVLERDNAPPGGYLVTRLDDPPARGRLDWSTVELTSFTGDRQVFKVNAAARAYFVRTARLWRGWRAFVDGREAPIETYQNMLQAVAFDAGTHVIELRYVPGGWAAGLALSAAGIVLELLLIGWALRRSRSSRPEPA
jgi:hypothetical protein